MLVEFHAVAVVGGKILYRSRYREAFHLAAEDLYSTMYVYELFLTTQDSMWTDEIDEKMSSHEYTIRTGLVNWHVN